jgi:hypothetical protein
MRRKASFRELGDINMPAVKIAEKALSMNDIKNKARGLGINPENMQKTQLIHSIQTAEGNTPCFGKSNNGRCPYTDCCFRKDCFKIKS